MRACVKSEVTPNIERGGQVQGRPAQASADELRERGRRGGRRRGMPAEDVPEDVDAIFAGGEAQIAAVVHDNPKFRASSDAGEDALAAGVSVGRLEGGAESSLVQLHRNASVRPAGRDVDVFRISNGETTRSRMR